MNIQKIDQRQILDIKLNWAIMPEEISLFLFSRETVNILLVSMTALAFIPSTYCIIYAKDVR